MKFRFIKYLRLLFNNCFIRLFFRNKEEQKKSYVSVCAIFKNEAKYLKEWIDYHLIVGVDHFYLYNNYSDDNYEKVLKPYIQRQLVTLIQWDMPAGQIPAYNDCLKRFGDDSSWIGFIDLDEFVTPLKFTNIPDWLKQFAKFPCVMCFWKMFSSSGLLKEDKEKPVVEQFFLAQEKHTSPKMFFNTRFRNWLASENFLHSCRLKFFGRVCPQYPHLFMYGSEKLRDPEIQINHYFNKSLAYYIEKKIPVGMADRAGFRTMDLFWDCENLAVVPDYSAWRFLIRLKTFDLDRFLENRL